MSRAKHTTPAWVDQLNEDVILKDAEDTSWFSGGYLGMPTRYHGEGGYINAYDTGYHRNHHDEISLRTRSSVRSRQKRNTCCLALFLIFAALLVAIGIGLMIYYLLRPDPMKYQSRIANGSLPLLNVPYSQDMQDRESRKFKDIENSLCPRIDEFFKGSVYEDKFEYCKVEFLRLDGTPLPCECSNITTPNKQDNARAYINLVFRGDIHRSMIHTIIEKHMHRVTGLDYDVLMLDDFIVDIESHRVLPTPTAKPIPDIGVRANLKIWVYNMTYTSDLKDRDTDSFKELATPFCNHLRHIFLTSKLESRYHSCQVQNFSTSPDIVITDVWFTGYDTSEIETSVRQIVLDNARKVNVSGQIRKMIGSLLITPSTGNDSTVTVITIPLNPESTIEPTPSTRPPKWKDGMPYVELYLNFTGVDYNASLWDTSSAFFKYHADIFCKDFERLIMQSSWKQKYYECNLLNIYPPYSGQFYPRLRTVIHVTYNTDSPSGLVDVIKDHADKYIFPDNLVTYKVGNFYVMPTGGQFNMDITQYGVDSTVVVPTTTGLFPSVFTSFRFSTPSRTSGQTGTPSVSTIVVVYNATAAYIESHLVDFDYTADLQDTTSNKFMYLEQQFCDDIDSYFASSSLQMYYETCKILSFSSDPKFLFVLQFTAPNGDYLQTAIPSVIIQNAPKARIGEYTVLQIGGLNLLYDAFGFTVSATNYTFDRTPTISPTETVTMTTTMVPPIYSATLINIFCNVASDILPALGNRNSAVFRALEAAFCKAISDIFTVDVRTKNTFLDCYVLQFSSDSSTVQFHAIFAEDARQHFGELVVDMLHLLAKNTLFEQSYHLDIGGVMVEPNSCRMNVYPVNYTDPNTALFSSLTPTSQVILPTAGLQHCLRQPCKNGGTCMETMDFYTCNCKSGFTGHDCEIDVDECMVLSLPCENGGTCVNKHGGHDCMCYIGYIGDRCETVLDRCASNPCKNGATCTGSQQQPCLCAAGWSGLTCEDDVDECLLVPRVCKFNGTCTNEVGSFKCKCVDGRTGPLCNEGIDECTIIQPCRNGASCLDTDYSYKCVCKEGWKGVNCTEDDDECSRDICENAGTCKNTIGSFECNCTSGWTGPTCNSRYDECRGVNPCLHEGTCVDTSSDFKCLCKKEWTGEFCQTDVNECLDTSICNGNGVCENFDGGFRCNCDLQWEGKYCDDDHDECSDTSLGQLCYNNGQCINQWGSYKCNCVTGWTGLDCKKDIDECSYAFAVCLHNGTCINEQGGFNCTCTSGWTGNRCQIDVDECLPPSPCLNNGTCTNKVGSFLCQCSSGWRGPLCQDDIDECTETPGVCSNGGTCFNEEGDYRCECPEGRGGKNCDYSTDPCDNILCAHEGTCVIDTNGDPKCMCTEQFEGEQCLEDFDECSLNPCFNGKCRNRFGTFYCDCDAGFTGILCDKDIDECLFYQCVNGYCNNTIGSFHCVCEDGWTGQFCNVDKSECSVLEKPCNDNGRCEETPGSYKCVCYFGYEGQFCQDDFDECSQIQCMNGGTCHNYPGGYQCNCTEFWTGQLCNIDLNECTTLENACLNGGTCRNKELGYDCTCTSQWRGETCGEDVDECSEISGLCMNNGTCRNVNGGFMCECTEAYTGEFCQTDKDECLLYKPCLNGATCRNVPGYYECICAEGFNGTNCENDVNECLENRCKNNAGCRNSPPGDYTCVCTDEWSGKDCDIEVERCPNCQNGGTCVNDDNNFKCVCPSGWEGDICQIDVDECTALSPCLNGGTCSNEQGDYSCACMSGYEGKNCEIDIDECSSDPCVFNGTCIDGINLYTCQCPTGRRGDNCEIDEDECVTLTMPCQHGGTCYDTVGSFKCTCTQNWEGQFCDIDKDECPMVSCVHGGTCVNTMGSFYCDGCDSGWIGQLCNTDKDECTVSTGNPCENGATCKNNEGSFECFCTDGWKGPLCSIDVNECIEFGTLACYGNGFCTNIEGDYLCNCSSGYTGERCDKDINECDDVPARCMNGGTCNNYLGTYDCDCVTGFEGQNCEKDKDECTVSTGNPCENGATCKNNEGSFECFCTDGWKGPLCSIDVNECIEFGTLACYGNGFCTNIEGDYLCNCSSGYTGERCDKDINECDDVPARCMNGGTCNNYLGTYDCDCVTGFEGQNCEKDKDECTVSTGNPCENGATCKNKEGSFECFCTDGWEGPFCSKEFGTLACYGNGFCTNIEGDYLCNCSSGYTGERCDKDINECDDVPARCMNGGTCNNYLGTYDCDCVTGFEGQNCEKDINECDASPAQCKNGGTCSNLPGTYNCDCVTGFQGNDCELDLDECSLGVCVNAISCLNTFGSYTCNCLTGWNGPNCDKDINECDASPVQCKNGGTCSNLPGTYNCDCVTGFEGNDCEFDLDECSLGVCVNAVSCLNTFGSYTCNCLSGWSGPNCDKDINECDASPAQCKNDGTCSNLPGTYNCDCVTGFEGNDCELDLDECSLGICVNDVSCLNTFGSYTCDCLSGWTGPNCDTDINECLADTICKNGGTCVNTDGSFTCSCAAGWQGPVCDMVGDNTFDLSFETVGLTITQDLLDTQSESFQRKQETLCNDIMGFVTHYLTPYESCNIVNFMENPAGLALRLSFGDGFPDGIGSTQIINLLFENRTRERFDDVYGIRVGDMVFKHSDYISTFVTMTKRLVDFTYENDLENENSFAFQNYENSFCSQVRHIMTINAFTFPNFTDCSVTDFSYDTGMDETEVTFAFEFEWTHDQAKIATDFDEYIDNNLDKFYFDRYEAAQIGDFYIYIGNRQSYTSVPLQYTLLDVPWQQSLSDNTSELFLLHSDAFCKEMSSLVEKHSANAVNYGGCSVQSYSVNPADQQFVNVNFNLEFFEALNIPAMRTQISNIINDNTPRERYMDYIGHRVSDLIKYDSIAAYFDIPYDGWIANFTFSYFDLGAWDNDLLDPTSDNFKEKTNAFCGGDPDEGAVGLETYVTTEKFYSTRFMRCFVTGYENDLSSLNALTSTASLLFLGIEPILIQEEFFQVLNTQSELVVIGNESYYLIGYDLVKVLDFEEIKVNISDYVVDVRTTTPLPEIADEIPMRFKLLNFTLQDEFLDTSSFIYTNSSNWFCRDMSRMVDLPRYAGCGNMSFSNEGNQTYLNFVLNFYEYINDKPQAVDQLLRVITEKAKRTTLPDDTVAIVIGPFKVYQDSLQPSITNPDIFRTPSPTAAQP